MRTTTTAAFALALVLTGCTTSSNDDPAPAQAAPTATAGGDGGSYASTAEILAALGENGLPCAEPQTGTFEGVSEAQSCILNDAEDVVLLRFATPAEKEDYVATKDEFSSAVVGENWAVQTVLPQTAEQVAAALGGEVRAGEGGEQPSG
ncbi:MAG: hypothetical protein M3P96_13285 [Actinomycetota bacterium]|nr:hypothetical protein [Actinomycetota bacterium]